MRNAAYRLIAVGMVFPVILLFAYLINGAHASSNLVIFAVVFVMPISLIFLVMGTLRLIQAIEHEAKAGKGPVKH